MPQLLGGSVDFRENHCTAAAAVAAAAEEEEEEEDRSSSNCRRPTCSSHPSDLLQLLSPLFRLGDNETSLVDDDDDSAAIAVEEEPITLKYDTYRRTRGSSRSSHSPGTASIQQEEEEEEEEEELLHLALVSQHHSLWAEYVYNAARVLADRIDDGRIDCRRMRCLELGR